jgi:hypothetical protein
MNKTLSIATLLTLALTLTQPLKADCCATVVVTDGYCTVSDSDVESNTSEAASSLQSIDRTLSNIYDDTSLGDLYDEINAMKNQLASAHDNSVLSNTSGKLTTSDTYNLIKAALSGDTTGATDFTQSVKDVNGWETAGASALSDLVGNTFGGILGDLTACKTPNLGLGNIGITAGLDFDINTNFGMNLPSWSVCDYGTMFKNMKNQVHNLTSRSFGGNLTIGSSGFYDTYGSDGSVQAKGLLHGALLEPSDANYATGQANFTAAVNVVPLSMGQVMMGAYLNEDAAKASTQFKASNAAIVNAMSKQAQASDVRRQSQNYNTADAVTDLAKQQMMAENRDGEYEEESLEQGSDSAQREQLRDQAAAQKEIMDAKIQQSGVVTGYAEGGLVP